MILASHNQFIQSEILEQLLVAEWALETLQDDETALNEEQEEEQMQEEGELLVNMVGEAESFQSDFSQYNALYNDLSRSLKSTGDSSAAVSASEVYAPTNEFVVLSNVISFDNNNSGNVVSTENISTLDASNTANLEVLASREFSPREFFLDFAEKPERPMPSEFAEREQGQFRGEARFERPSGDFAELARVEMEVNPFILG